MFGYVRPLKGEMKVREYEKFKAVYCGLCHTLGKRRGFLSRFILNFEFTFLAMLLSDVESACYRYCRCVASPFKRKACLVSDAGLERAADYSVILCWWKLRDTISDEGFFVSLATRLLCLLLRGAYRRAKAARREFDELVRSRLSELKVLESEKCGSIDRTSDKFALILEACSDDTTDSARKRALGQLLYHAGRMIYILDAVDDLPRDLERGEYNPVALRFGLRGASVGGEVTEELRITLSHSQNLMISAFQLLPPGLFTEILSNIIYEGIPWVADMVLTGRWKSMSKIYRRPRSIDRGAKE